MPKKKQKKGSFKIVMTALRGRPRNMMREMQQQGSEDNEQEVVADDTNELQPEQRSSMRGRPLKSSYIMEQYSPRSARKSSQSSPAKRTKREQLAALQAQKLHAESYIMKLFDRSLDLSKFTEDTPLYPICRAWMENNPRPANLRSQRDQRAQPVVKSEIAGKELLDKLRSGEITTVTAMPSPQHTDFPRFPTFSSELLDPQEAEKLEGASKEELLAWHKPRWQKIRSKWNVHVARYNQERWGINRAILMHLYKQR